MSNPRLYDLKYSDDELAERWGVSSDDVLKANCITSHISHLFESGLAMDRFFANLIDCARYANGDRSVDIPEVVYRDHFISPVELYRKATDPVEILRLQRQIIGGSL